MLSQISKVHITISENKYYNSNPWTNVYGLARSILALSLLCTLLFTGREVLFPIVNGNLIKNLNFFFEKISIYYIFQENIDIAYYLSIVILLWVISGYTPQLTGVLHWWVSYSYLTSGIIIEGGDQIVSIITLLLIPICITDNRINHWNRKKATNNIYLKLFVWSVYFVIILQISIVYFHSAIAKFNVDEWINGTATYYWFTHNTFGFSNQSKQIVAHLMSNTFLVISCTWGGILLEIILFGWIFMKRNKWNWKLLFVLGVFFHLMIAVVFGLASFGITMIGALILYLFPKDTELKFNKLFDYDSSI